MFGPVTNKKNLDLPDLRPREWAYFLPILVLIFWIGVYPQTFLKPVQPAIEQTISLTQERAEMCRELDARVSLSSRAEER
jgi:NADH:ubiquinone oxidoreductase subunit 4 (subunit M)